MISLFSYLLSFLMVIFWFFRVWTVLAFQLDMEFFAKPLDTNVEIGLLFLSLPCMVLVFKRNFIGAAGLLSLYTLYFGDYLYSTFSSVSEVTSSVGASADVMFCVIGIVLPALIFIDCLLNKNRGFGKGNPHTNWFYTNDKYDRKFDDRADRNQYKF